MLLPTGKRTFTSAHSTGMCAALTEQYVPDYIGRLENLAEDFPRVGEQIGVKLELPHMLHSLRRAQYGGGRAPGVGGWVLRVGLPGASKQSVQA